MRFKIILLVLAIVLISGCSKSSIVGCWRYENEEGTSTTVFTFSESGEYTLEIIDTVAELNLFETGTYTFEDDRLVLNHDFDDGKDILVLDFTGDSFTVVNQPPEFQNLFTRCE